MEGEERSGVRQAREKSLWGALHLWSVLCIPDPFRALHFPCRTAAALGLGALLVTLPLSGDPVTPRKPLQGGYSSTSPQPARYGRGKQRRMERRGLPLG